MFDHIALRAGDIGSATRFYDAVLTALGHARCYTHADMIGYGRDDQPVFWLYRSDAAAGGTHVAFAAPDRRAVASFHEAGLAAGGRDNGAPGPRPDYGPTYYAAFLIDPDGNNVEAVCMSGDGR
jgi:catechol 2,3-dioxygenase-like lactoylglutathione lyase family enzyme